MHEHRDTHFANSQYMGAAKTYQQPFTQRPAPISVPVRGGRARRGHGRSRGALGARGARTGSRRAGRYFLEKNRI